MSAALLLLASLAPAAGLPFGPDRVSRELLAGWEWAPDCYGGFFSLHADGRYEHSYFSASGPAWRGLWEVRDGVLYVHEECTLYEYETPDGAGVPGVRVYEFRLRPAPRWAGRHQLAGTRGKGAPVTFTRLRRIKR